MANDEPISVTPPRIRDEARANEIISLGATTSAPTPTPTGFRQLLPTPPSLTTSVEELGPENSEILTQARNIRYTTDEVASPILSVENFERGWRTNLANAAESNDNLREDFSRALSQFSLDPRSWWAGGKSVAGVAGNFVVGQAADGIQGELYQYSADQPVSGITLPATNRSHINYSDPFDTTVELQAGLGSLNLGVGWSQPEHISVSGGGITNHKEDAYTVTVSWPFGNNTGGGRGSRE